jgi:hypothetical protein
VDVIIVPLSDMVTPAWTGVTLPAMLNAPRAGKTSTAARFHRSVVGAVSEMLILVPLSEVVLVCICTQ